MRPAQRNRVKRTHEARSWRPTYTPHGQSASVASPSTASTETAPLGECSHRAHKPRRSSNAREAVARGLR
jgi:hypothetical protein